MNPPIISVVIPCRNEAKYIRATIESVLRQSNDLKDMEIIVVDGMSTDDTRNILNEYTTRVPQLCLLENQHIITASARNMGILKSRGEFIALIDGHCEISSDYLMNCYNLLGESPADIVCVAGRTRTVGSSFTGNAIALAMSSPFGVGNASFRHLEKEADVDTAAFGVYRRSVFDEVGYYDENLPFAEDDELSFRIIRAGYKIRMIPKVSAKYFARESYWELWRQYYNYGRGKVLVFRKHGQLPSWRAIVPPTFVLVLFWGFTVGLFWRPLLWIWISCLAIYSVTGLAVAFAKARRDMPKSLAIFRAFVCLHIGYGAGVLNGILDWLLLNLTMRKHR